MQRQGNLDQPGDPRGRFGVTDDGFDRAQCYRLGRGALGLQRPGDGLGLGLVADRRSGAMRLDQAQVGGSESGLCIGPVQGAHLAFGSRRGHA